MVRMPKIVSRIREIKLIGQDIRRSPVAVSNRSVVFPRGTIVMMIVLAAMFTVPWILKKATAFNVNRMMAGRGGGAAVVAALESGTAPGGMSEGGPLAQGRYAIFYSPGVDLEKKDVAMIGSARVSIDAALYSATDYAVCDALAAAATRGVKVRVYRDREQYEQEMSLARGRETCSTELSEAGALVKVKGSRELMHLKAYVVDGSLLRTGSANLSLSGEKRQDNDAVFISVGAAVKHFESNFEDLWNRDDNEVVARGGR